MKTITEKQELLAAITAGLHQQVDGFLVAKHAEGLSAGTLRKIHGPLASRGNQGLQNPHSAVQIRPSPLPVTESPDFQGFLHFSEPVNSLFNTSPGPSSRYNHPGPNRRHSALGQ